MSPPSLDLQDLLKKGIISQETLDWMAPFKKAEEQADEGANLLFQTDASTDEEEEDLTNIITLDGKVIPYVCDEIGARGHGDRIWAASIALCQVLRKELSSERPLQVLELGAGVAIPSLYCAQWLCKESEVVISDRQDYPNIKQILESVAVQQDRSAKIAVHPLTWGEGKLNRVFDVLIVSDCLYNPEYHSLLKDTIYNHLADTGNVYCSFSLHGNTDDNTVWVSLTTSVSRVRPW